MPKFHAGKEKEREKELHSRRIQKRTTSSGLPKEVKKAKRTPDQKETSRTKELRKPEEILQKIQAGEKKLPGGSGENAQTTQVGEYRIRGSKTQCSKHQPRKEEEIL